VVANGDITDVHKAKHVLEYTQADALMIGRGAQGNPWIFREILHFLQTGQVLAAPSIGEVSSILLEHVTNVHEFYGEYLGARIARKHVGWYLAEHDKQRQFRAKFNSIEDASQQLDALNQYFETFDVDSSYFDRLADETVISQNSPAA
jgi:tRNA-dihydrouridine synthase B